MASAPTFVINALANTEARLRQRLDRCANRLEDNDPIDLIGLRLGVKMLNVVDNTIGFRILHRTSRQDAFQAIVSPPLPATQARPELGGLLGLKPHERGRLKSRYRAWTSLLESVAASPLSATNPTGGHSVELDDHPRLQALWTQWQEQLNEYR
jgi:hypothetical protein